jgi:DNA-binding winged helix-turn-helix (wHTH) protein/TolB-like protein/Flp pilus assembly protein TadD
MAIERKRLYEFGPFCLDTSERVLSHAGQPVPITPKVFEILLTLVENSGRLIEKDELMKKVWPDSYVEDSNLTFNISVLRKALAKDAGEQTFIETVPRRGYRFIAPVREVTGEQSEVFLREQSDAAFIPVEDLATDSQEEMRVALPAPAGEPPDNHKNLLFTLPVIASGALLIVLALALYYMGDSGEDNQTSGKAISSVAVLPFKPLSYDGADDYLGLGLADTLITRLSSLNRIVVRPTSTVRKYADLSLDPVQAGRELKVESVLEGSLQRSGDRIRLTLRLVNVEDGRSIWANTFDEHQTDLFKVQDSISERVAAALALTLTGEEQKQLTRKYTQNTEAYHLYLKGRFYWNKRTSEGMKKAIEHFEKAIQKDSNYVLAYAGLADAYSMPDYTGLPQQDSYQQAQAAAAKAVEIDDTLAEAHTSLAYVAMRHRWDWPQSEKELKHALSINPGYARAHHLYAIYLELMGRSEEAIVEAKRAQDLDPLSPAISESYGSRLLNARQYDQAIEELRNTIEMEPNFALPYLTLGQAYLQKGMLAEALTVYQRFMEIENSPWGLGGLGYAYAISGRRSEAQKIIGQLQEQSQRPYFPWEEIARVCIGLGDKNQAMAWLEKAYQARSDHLVFIKIDPAWDDMRSDPRFLDLLRRIGLPTL